MTQFRLVLITAFVIATYSPAQPSITIHVSANERIGPFKPIWTYFGYDEANYTYTANGRKLIRELSNLSRTPVYIRTHNLLTTGDGIPALKWSSTNAYTEDAAGKPVYNWTIVDKIFDAYLAAGAKPFVEIGFMPEALSTHPQPYKHTWPKGEIDTGWAYPPNNYSKWDQLIYEWVRHCVDKYGHAEVESWYWEVWNEPDIFYWHGTPEQYDELYDHTAAAVKRALPAARVGGPASTGPASPKAAAFLRQFLQHCATARSPLDFISYHAKGRPEVVDGRIHMGLSRQLNDVATGFQIIAAFRQFRDLPIFLSESDPEGCAACSAQTHPQNAYRNGALYPVYEAEALDKILKLAARDHANLAGILTWAFEFEDQPYFAGFRTLATNGIDKPVLNFFRMAGLMRGDIVKSENDRDVNSLAVRSENNIVLMIWRYNGESIPVPPAEVETVISGIPATAGRVLLEHYRIDRNHSNSYTAWQEMGSPPHPSSAEYANLEAAGQLQMLESPRWLTVRNGTLDVRFFLKGPALSLLRLSW
jgi:xylan 1,4-beta-xylosidase